MLIKKQVVGHQAVVGRHVETAGRINQALVGKLQPRQPVNQRIRAGNTDCHVVGVELHLPAERKISQVQPLIDEAQNLAGRP